jgi:hypothetical protein
LNDNPEYCNGKFETPAYLPLYLLYKLADKAFGKRVGNQKITSFIIPESTSINYNIHKSIDS